jgi:WD40 repeat protein
VEAGSAAWGDNHGSIEAGEGQAWEYAGEAGERLSILVAADRPVNHNWSVESQLKNELLDPVLAVYSPDGSLLAAADDLENGIATDAYLADISLPLTGIFRVEVRSYRDRTGGGYRLSLGEPRPLVFRADVRTTGGLAITLDGKSALVGVGQDPLFINPAEDNRIWVWDLESGEAIRWLEGHQNTPINVAVSPNGRQVLSGSVDGVAILWDQENGEEIRRFKIADIEISGIRFHPNGRMAIVATFEPGLMLLDLSSGEVIRRFEGHQGLIPDMVISADGKTAYSTSFDGTLHKWDVDTGKALAVFEPFDGSPTNGLALSADGSRLLVGGGDAFARPFESVNTPIALLDANTGERLLDLEGHTSVVKSIAFSPDGRYALSGSRDTTVRLWDLTTGEALAAFAGHTQEVWKVAFSPDGQTGFSTSRDGSFRVWDLNAYIGESQIGSP